MIVSEPVRSVVWPQDLSDCPELACGINEHTYTIFHYLVAALAAGLLPQIYFPRSIKRQLNQGDLVVAQELGKSYGILSRLWRHHLGRWAAQGVLLPIVYAISNMPLVMIAKKLKALPA